MATHQDIKTAWKSLSSTGTPPSPDISARVLPEWSVGIDAWQDRLVNTYLRDYCAAGEGQESGNSDFKLVIADYGGGKTHFLHAFRRRALDEGFAACYIQCKEGVSFNDWMGLYSRIARSIRLPGSDVQGMRQIVEAAKDALVAKSQHAPNPDSAFEAMLNDLAWREYPNSVFLEVVTKAIRLSRERMDPELFKVAINWLQDGQLTVTNPDLSRLNVRPLPRNELAEFGRSMFYSLVKFVTEFGGAKGLVLLLDEMDIMFTARGKALERLLAALRTMIDQSDDRIDNIPVFGLFAAVPAINDQMHTNYHALYQRFSVTVPFHSGSDTSPQIDLAHLGSPREILTAIGSKLVKLASDALGTSFDYDIQRANVHALVRVAEARVANVDSRRPFVKTWCALLDEQHRLGERIYEEADLNSALKGTYDGIKNDELREEEDDG